MCFKGIVVGLGFLNSILHDSYFMKVTATVSLEIPPKRNCSWRDGSEILQKQIHIPPRGVSTCREGKTISTHTFGSPPYLSTTNLEPNPTEPFDQAMGKAKKSREKGWCLCPWLLLPKPRGFKWKPIRKPHMAKLASEGCWGVIFCFKE